jgi:diguanylate cyclase (GGDEF)-like protein
MKNPIDSVSFRQSLLQLLEANPPEEERLLAGFESVKAQGQPLYATLLYILTHLNFSETEAERHWNHIRRHRDALQMALGRDVGLRVALLDYFVNLNRELKNPKVIEISIYESTARSAVTDGLTSLYNHAYFLGALRRETQRARRHAAKLSLVMIDLDNFKRLNDTRGHLEGDKVLLKAAALVTENLREIDIAARYGGEEFAVILPDTPRMGGFVAAERIRARVEEHFRRRRSSGAVTISGGVATFPDDAGDHEQLIRRADEALYRSKAGGKNRITLVGGERRRHRRVPVSQPVLLQPEEGPAASARAENVSERGLLVRLREPLPVGCAVTVSFKGRGADSAAVPGEVVRVEPAPEGAPPGFELGLRLLGDLAPSGSWLSRRVPASV